MAPEVVLRKLPKSLYEEIDLEVVGAAVGPALADFAAPEPFSREDPRNA